MLDKIGHRVIKKFRRKYEAGMVEHGGGLQFKTTELHVWIREIQNEALDTAAYCEKVLQDMGYDEPPKGTWDD